VKDDSDVRSRLSLCGVAVVLTVLMATGGAQPALAQASDAAERCTPDVMRLCSEFVPDAGRITACLKAKRRQLTPSCATARQPQCGKHKRRAHRSKG
jgi:hypothetical protein